MASLNTLIEERAAGFAFIARALTVVGTIALVLCLMGIYSLMTFLTALDQDVKIVIKKKPRSRAAARISVVAV